ncbi:MAG: alpha/beta hydrolase family protein [Gaiellaceae bacterium]
MVGHGLDSDAIGGEAAGVPFIALPPRERLEQAPLVIAWHMLDPPRSETAMAAALPLNGLDAWRVYLGLPLSGTRLPAGGLDEVFALGSEDAVLNLDAPIVRHAVEEFTPALSELRRRFGVADRPLGLIGASAGAFVAQTVLAESETAVAAAALVSPAIRLSSVVAANERRFGVSYPWSDASRNVAARFDFTARADEIARRLAPTLLVVGANDDTEGFMRPAEELRDLLSARGVEASLVRIPRMAHALAEEPGLEPAEQTRAAAAVDDALAAWFNRHLAPRTEPGGAGQAR